jgi:hypothetical protein
MHQLNFTLCIFYNKILRLLECSEYRIEKNLLRTKPGLFKIAFVLSDPEKYKIVC